ncbi:hypothetical protein [Aureibacter tunicatorum]|uniref:Lipoprotein n=1 Tax=Aureibacter tunicatorum TaxID=866807 RepID=A0AAE4BTJ2_9BACT|nr:hypothetical protein [Aureibacter tunicatorum]MDR6240010.1 hypothetical protein [Aureibacter tunicatorum]
MKKAVSQRFITTCHVILGVFFIQSCVYVDPLYYYERAYESKDREFFLSKLEKINQMRDFDELVNELLLISGAANIYILDSSEIPFDKEKLQDFDVIKVNVMFCLSSLFTSKSFFSSDRQFDLSDCRVYSHILTEKERIAMIQKINRHTENKDI